VPLPCTTAFWCTGWGRFFETVSICAGIAPLWIRLSYCQSYQMETCSPHPKPLSEWRKFYFQCHLAMISKQVCNSILSQSHEGIRVGQIVRNFKNLCSRATVYRVLQHHSVGTPVKRKTGPLRKLDCNGVKRVVRALTVGKRHCSIRMAARREGCDPRTVRRLMKTKDIKTFKKKKRFLITKAHAERRKICCRRFRKKFSSFDLARMVWVDECYIVVGEYFNNQNERCYGRKFEMIPDFKKYRDQPKSPLRAMVFVAVWPGGNSGLVVLPSGFKITAASYIEHCLKPLLESLPEDWNQKQVIFHQDLAPAHRAKKTQEFLKSKLPRFVPAPETPPSSPDLNPLDYCLWSELKERLAKHQIVPNFQRLKEILIKEWQEIPEELFWDSCNCWLKRVRKVEQANGGHID